MSYIRTIMGSIYKVDNNKYGVIEENGIFKKYCENMGHSWYSELVATNQSENLEKLCDEFVMTHYFPETNYTKCEVLKEDKDLMIKAVRLKKQHNKDEELKNEFNIYGAIWTSKGLIYVAKMDNKGKLELI